jgi:aromatic ring hydroxylase
MVLKKKVKIKNKITNDFLIKKYLQAKQETDLEKRERLIQQVKDLTQYIGYYLGN